MAWCLPWAGPFLLVACVFPVWKLLCLTYSSTSLFLCVLAVSSHFEGAFYILWGWEDRPSVFISQFILTVTCSLLELLCLLLCSPTFPIFSSPPTNLRRACGVLLLYMPSYALSSRMPAPPVLAFLVFFRQTKRGGIILAGRLVICLALKHVFYQTLSQTMCTSCYIMLWTCLRLAAAAAFLFGWGVPCYSSAWLCVTLVVAELPSMSPSSVTDGSTQRISKLYICVFIHS